MGNEQNRNSSGHRDRTFGVRCVSRPATVEDVEEEGYLKANPDVARAGVSARAASGRPPQGGEAAPGQVPFTANHTEAIRRGY